MRSRPAQITTKKALQFVHKTITVVRLSIVSSDVAIVITILAVGCSNTLKVFVYRGLKECTSDRSRQALSIMDLVAKIFVETAESEALRVWITDLSDHSFDHFRSGAGLAHFGQSSFSFYLSIRYSKI